MGADEENISRAFCRKRGLDPDTMVNVDGNGTMLPLWQVWTSDAALDAVSEAGKKAEWVEAVRAVCLDDVDEALREFAMDPTGDNGTKVAREFMRAFSAITPPRQENEGEPDSECKEADGCPTEGGVLKKFWREHQPDPKLCEFYQVKTWAELVAAQEEHIISLQGAAVRNVKPWEDTFPPTLLPKYLRETGLDAAEPKVQTVVVYGATPPESGGQGEASGAVTDAMVDAALSARVSEPLLLPAAYPTVEEYLAGFTPAELRRVFRAAITAALAQGGGNER